MNAASGVQAEPCVSIPVCHNISCGAHRAISTNLCLVPPVMQWDVEELPIFIGGTNSMRVAPSWTSFNDLLGCRVTSYGVVSCQIKMIWRGRCSPIISRGYCIRAFRNEREPLGLSSIGLTPPGLLARIPPNQLVL